MTSPLSEPYAESSHKFADLLDLLRTKIASERRESLCLVGRAYGHSKEQGIHVDCQC